MITNEWYKCCNLKLINVLFLDAAALLHIQETLKQKNKSIVEIKLRNEELMNDKIEIHRSYALKLGDVGKLKDLQLRAEGERDLLKQNMQQVKDENRKWKEELKHSATVLGSTIRQNKGEKSRLNDEIHIGKKTSEALRREILTNQQELDRMRIELKLG